MKGQWYIYKITNLINGKSYIGKKKHKESDTPLEESYMGSGRLIKEAIAKYGKDNFKKEIIEENIPSNQEAALKEVIWITYHKEKGEANYNICYGINSKRGDFLTEKESFKGFLNNPSDQKSVIEDLKQIIENDEGLTSFYNDWEEEKKKTWGEKISQSLKRYNAGLSEDKKAELSKHLSEAQIKYLREKETEDHRKKRSRNQSIGQGKEYEIIDPAGNFFKIKGLALWCRDIFGEDNGNTAVSTLRCGSAYKGYKLVITEDYKTANKMRTYKIRTPNNDVIEVANLDKFCREVLNGSKALRLRGKYQGFFILDKRDSTSEEKEIARTQDYRILYKDYVLPKTAPYKPDKTYIIETPDHEILEISNLGQWCLDTFKIKSSYTSILMKNNYKGYKILDRYNTSRKI